MRLAFVFALLASTAGAQYGTNFVNQDLNTHTVVAPPAITATVVSPGLMNLANTSGAAAFVTVRSPNFTHTWQPGDCETPIRWHHTGGTSGQQTSFGPISSRMGVLNTIPFATQQMLTTPTGVTRSEGVFNTNVTTGTWYYRAELWVPGNTTLQYYSPKVTLLCGPEAGVTYNPTAGTITADITQGRDYAISAIVAHWDVGPTTPVPLPGWLKVGTLHVNPVVSIPFVGNGFSLTGNPAALVTAISQGSWQCFEVSAAGPAACGWAWN